MDTQLEPVFLHLNKNSKKETRVNLLEFVKEKNIKIVYWDLGGTLADISYKNKKRIVREINNTCNSNINIAAYDSVIKREWEYRETPEAREYIKAVKTDEDEQKYWIEFFSCVLRNLEINGEYPQLAEWLGKVQVDPQSFEIFSYVHNILEKLGEMGIPIGIISNTFPSARKILIDTGLIQKISLVHVILSCEQNSVKPEEKIYQIAVESANVKPHEILFIDDRNSFVEGASNFGMESIKLSVAESKAAQFNNDSGLDRFTHTDFHARMKKHYGVEALAC